MRLVPTLVIGVVAVAVVAVGVTRYAGHQQGPAPTVLALAEPAPLSTPPGVTFVTAKTGGTVLLATAGIQIPATAAAYADGKGMTLYTYDKDEGGKSACTGDCATMWPVVSAPADAKPFGDWTVVTRDDGSKQWALKGKPLYTYSKDAKPGDGGGNGTDQVWHIALAKFGEGYKMPDGLALLDSANAAGEALVNDQGKPLYIFDKDPKGGKPSCIAQPCTDHWSPYVAAQLAKPVGDFTVIDRGDGMFQWAFKGKPLYTYDGDVDAGETNGNGLDNYWHVATIMRNFMPSGVTIAHNRFGGNTLALSDGRPLYINDRVVSTQTGHNLRTGVHGNPTVGKILGTATCVAECTKTWIPLAAPADAQPSAYWDVVTRDDGTKQWSYRGFAVYSFVNDKKPGDMLGNDTYQIMGEADPFVKADTGIKGTGALFWHTATP